MSRSPNVWIRTSTSNPSDGRYLICNRYTDQVEIGVYKDGGWCHIEYDGTLSGTYLSDAVSHWTFLPEVPSK